jgi:hypothetical protein
MRMPSHIPSTTFQDRRRDAEQRRDALHRGEEVVMLLGYAGWGALDRWTLPEFSKDGLFSFGS